MWLHPTPKDYDFKSFEYTLSEAAFTKVTDLICIL